MRIVMDVSPLSAPPTGIGNYLRETLGAAARLAPDDRLVALSLGGVNETPRLLRNLAALPASVERHHVCFRGGSRARRLVNASPLPLLERLAGGPCDAFLGSEWLYPRQRSGRRLALVHDLVPLRFPETTTRATRRLHLRKLEDARRADAVLTNSAATAADVAAHLGVAAERLHVARPGVADRFREPAPVPARAAAGRPYLVALSTVEPRKNLGALVDAFALLAPGHPDLVLLLVGMAGWGDDPIAGLVRSHGLEDRVVRTGYLPDDEVPGLLAAAAAFCLPALFEGFGMPVAEALAAGAATVCSDDPSLDEAAGDAAWRAPARDPRALAETLEHALGDADERTRRRALGIAHTARLTWAETARVLLAAARG